ncbi:MAG: M23 family metallopeptidase, partial [Bdellovibrionales bacterium]|nr:M23 family metallopeptidase [Bdellovibrionales bacterium]
MSATSVHDWRGLLGFRVLGVAALWMLLSGCGFGAGRPSLQSAPVHYTVRAGDTLQSIAARAGVAPTRIALLNGLRDPNRIRAGQRLFLGYQNVLGTGGSVPEGAGRIVPASLVRRGTPVGRPARLSWPVPGGRVSSRFGPRRGSFHDGLDIAAPRGTPVLAAHDAVVIYSDDGLSGYGNLIILRSP